MSLSVRINPNLRVEGDCTVVDLDEDVHGASASDLLPGTDVTVYEPSSGLIGRGWILEVDSNDRTVLVKVDWAGLRIGANATTFGGAFVLEPNMDAPFRSVARVA